MNKLVFVAFTVLFFGFFINTLSTVMVRFKVSRKRTQAPEERSVRRRLDNDLSSDSEDGGNNVSAELVDATQVTPSNTRPVSSKDINDFLNSLPPEQLAGIFTNLQKQVNSSSSPAPSAWMSPTPLGDITAPESPTDSYDNTPTESTNEVYKDPDTLIIARADMMEHNSNLLSEYGGGMDDRVLRQVKLTPEYVKKQSRMVGLVSIIAQNCREAQRAELLRVA